MCLRKASSFSFSLKSGEGKTRGEEAFKAEGAEVRVSLDGSAALTCIEETALANKLLTAVMFLPKKAYILLKIAIILNADK
jgi:hypothetical protein